MCYLHKRMSYLLRQNNTNGMTKVKLKKYNNRNKLNEHEENPIIGRNLICL